MDGSETLDGELGEVLRRRPIEVAELLDRTQGHLILRWAAWRAPDALRRIGLPSLYCGVALCFLIGFGIESLVVGRTAHGVVLLAFAALTIASYGYLRMTGRRHVMTTFVVLLLGALCLYLLWTGGVDGTGPLWFYVFPLFALFVQRLWAGLFSVVALFGMALLLLEGAVPGFDPAIYSGAFQERFLAVYVAVSAMAFLYAFLRVSAELQLRNLSVELRELANTDMLTRLPNRRAMQEVLYQEISRARRNHAPFSVILLDMDRFKSINDTYGHEGGDRVLQQLPLVARDVLRAQDRCGRWGGEEFLVLLPGTGPDGARYVAERLRKAIEEHPFTYEGMAFKATASLGIGEFRPTDSLDDCVKRADRSLYAAKTAGRNQVGP